MRKLKKIENICYLIKKNIGYSITNFLTNDAIVLSNNYLKISFRNCEKKKKGYKILLSHSYLKYHDTKLQNTKKTFYKLEKLQTVLNNSDSMLFLLTTKEGLLNCVNLGFDYKQNSYNIVPNGSNTLLKKNLFVKALFQKKQFQIKQNLNKIKALIALKNTSLICIQCDSKLLNLDTEIGNFQQEQKYETKSK